MHIDWGDGTNPRSEVYLSTGSLGSEVHTYELDGSYTVTEVITDSLGASVQQSFVINVQNVPPHIDGLTVSPELPLGQTAFLSLSFSDPGLLDSFQGQINWGDGSTISFQRPAGQYTVNASHPYVLEPGTFTVSATLIDHGGGEATTSATVARDGSAEVAAAKTVLIAPRRSRPRRIRVQHPGVLQFVVLPNSPRYRGSAGDDRGTALCERSGARLRVESHRRAATPRPSQVRKSKPRRTARPAAGKPVRAIHAQAILDWIEHVGDLGSDRGPVK